MKPSHFDGRGGFPPKSAESMEFAKSAESAESAESVESIWFFKRKHLAKFPLRALNTGVA
jgi:hypothetical protein